MNSIVMNYMCYSLHQPIIHFLLISVYP